MKRGLIFGERSSASRELLDVRSDLALGVGELSCIVFELLFAYSELPRIAFELLLADSEQELNLC